MSTWQPLIDATAERRVIQSVIREIASGLDVWYASHPAGGDAQADRALLRDYLGRDRTVDDPDDVVTESIVAAIERTEAGGIGLFGGIAHTAWTVAHLSTGDDAETVCAAIEASILRMLEQPVEQYDLISGLVGFGILAIERSDSASGARLAARVLDHLDRLAVVRSGGLAWHTPVDLLPANDRAEAPEGVWNLGVAHGVPGVIAMLARFVANGLDAERATRLLDGAVAYLLAAEPRRDFDRYPVWHPRPASPAPGRVAWCYGDLGVSLALIAAATARDRDDWRADAIALAHGMARRSFEDSQVVDTNLCHGAAGAAHLFNRLYQATGDAELGATARRWIDRTLALRRDDAIAGFPAFRHALGYQPIANMLMGASGVALALHAAITDVEPSWDRILVADVS